jgi:predicted peptidase
MISISILFCVTFFHLVLSFPTNPLTRRESKCYLQAELPEEINSRRAAMKAVLGILSLSPLLPCQQASAKVLQTKDGELFEIDGGDASYPAIIYQPRSNDAKKLPVIVLIHGAGENEMDVWNLANPSGEHAGLAPSVLASGNAPSILSENFIVIAPYSIGKRSFYEEPRRKLLEFIDWVCSTEGGGKNGVDTRRIDPRQLFLFGFSDGATLGVELLTTGKFAGGVIAAYGFTGTLPPLAIERLKDIPLWVFHSKDDVIFPVACSDRLVSSLQKANTDKSIVKYTRFDHDQEGFTGSVRGHSTGITATRTPEVYQWLLSLNYL